MRNNSLEKHGSAGWAVAVTIMLSGFSPVLALLGAVIAGAAVEAIQWAFPSTGYATWEDVAYTGIGGLFGTLLGVAVLAIF